MTMERRSWMATFCLNCAAVQSGGVLGFKTSFWVLIDGSFKGRWHWMLCTQLSGFGPPSCSSSVEVLFLGHPLQGPYGTAWRESSVRAKEVCLTESCWSNSFFLSRALLKTFSRWRASCEGRILWSDTAVPSLGCSAVVGGCRQHLNQAQRCNTTLFKVQY